VTGVVRAVGVYYADYEFGERGVCVACSLHECFAEEEGEFGVAVVGWTGAEATFLGGSIATGETRDSTELYTCQRLYGWEEGIAQSALTETH